MKGSPETLTLAVNVAHDGKYWVVECPALRMAAAHRLKAKAWGRGIRMFMTQLSYGFNLDPACKSLFAHDHQDEIATIRRAQRNGVDLDVSFRAQAANLRVDIPDVLAVV